MFRVMFVMRSFSFITDRTVYMVLAVLRFLEFSSNAARHFMMFDPTLFIVLCWTRPEIWFETPGNCRSEHEIEVDFEIHTPDVHQGILRDGSAGCYRSHA
jgi:hypothetical protein